MATYASVRYNFGTQLTGEIPTAAIADDAITLAKMASGTDGNIITYDASGNPAVVASGTSGHFLKSQGADTVPVFAAAGGNDGLPYFWASRTSDQNITDATETKVEMDNEVLDSGSCYDDSTNYRWTPNVAGKFFIFAQVYTVGNVADNMNDAYAQLKKNGSAIAPYIETIPNANGRGWPQQLSTIVDMNGTDDYLEIYGYMNTSTGNAYFGSAADPNNKTYWWGYRIAT